MVVTYEQVLESFINEVNQNISSELSRNMQTHINIEKIGCGSSFGSWGGSSKRGSRKA